MEVFMRVYPRHPQRQSRLPRLFCVLSLFFLFTIIFAPSLPVLAQGQPGSPARAGDSDPVWRARYWNNRDLSGDPVLERDETEINYDWRSDSPENAVNDDNFSARWTRYLYLEQGRYRFEANSDDGVRVYVDGQRIINGWSNHGVQSFSATLDLNTGHHLVQVDYYENSGAAVIRFNWNRVSGGGEPTIQNWRGEYFNNPDLSGSPALVRDDNNIDFNWGNGSPGTGVNADNFSARWQRSQEFGAGNYRFEVTVDDGARLWVNNQLVIDQWRVQNSTTYRGDIYLPGGAVPLRLEYFERSGGARVRLSWTRTDQPQEPEITNWRGEYFNNRDLSGNPALVRNDSEINFDWGSGSPDGNINSDNFSVRWTRRPSFESGRYLFTTQSDDGVRLFIDDRLVIDQWRELNGDKFTYEVNLGKGSHKVRLEYFEKGGRALAKLSWKRLGDVQAPIGNLITCVPPQPKNYAWIKIYRLDGNNKWYSIGRGIGSIQASGFLKLDGLPVDSNRFGSAGEPYKIEQWIDGKVAQSTGDFYAGQPEFRLRTFADNYTPWQCQ
jgi:PA14 domain